MHTCTLTALGYLSSPMTCAHAPPARARSSGSQRRRLTGEQGDGAHLLLTDVVQLGPRVPFSAVAPSAGPAASRKQKAEKAHNLNWTRHQRGMQPRLRSLLCAASFADASSCFLCVGLLCCVGGLAAGLAPGAAPMRALLGRILPNP